MSIKLKVVKLDGKWGCFNPKENSISLNISLWEKHQSKAWVLSVLAHECTHWKKGHSKKDCPEFEYLAQSVANEMLCKKYKDNPKNILFRKNNISLEKWQKLLPKGVHYGLKLKAKKLADEFWNSDEFWKLFKTANELGGIQVKNESPNTIGDSVDKIQVAQPGEPDCKAYKQGVNTTPTVKNKEVLTMSKQIKMVKPADVGFINMKIEMGGQVYTILAEQHDSVSFVSKSFSSPGEIRGSNGNGWEIAGVEVTPELTEALNSFRKELNTLIDDVFDLSEKGELLRETTLGETLFQSPGNSCLYDNPLYRDRFNCATGTDERELRDGWVRNLTQDELTEIRDELLEYHHKKELENADYFYWLDKDELKPIMGELLETIEICPSDKVSKAQYELIKFSLLKDTEKLIGVIREFEEFDMLLSKNDFNNIREINPNIEYEVKIDEYTGEEYCRLSTKPLNNKTEVEVEAEVESEKEADKMNKVYIGGAMSLNMVYLPQEFGFRTARPISKEIYKKAVNNIDNVNIINCWGHPNNDWGLPQALDEEGNRLSVVLKEGDVLVWEQHLGQRRAEDGSIVGESSKGYFITEVIPRYNEDYSDIIKTITSS